MWTNSLVHPGHLVHREVQRPSPDHLHPGQVIVRLLCGAICGSDLPGFRGQPDLTHGLPSEGFPLHEIVGEVVVTRSASLAVGDRVVGFATGSRGMSEYFVNADTQLIAVDSQLSNRELVAVQSLATVLNAFSRAYPAPGQAAAIIGQGPLGLLWAHVLKAGGAARVTGVDIVDRHDVAGAFGVDEVVWKASADWAGRLDGPERPALVVEAVGHQVGTLNDAIRAGPPRGRSLPSGCPTMCTTPLPSSRCSGSTCP